MRKKYIPIVVAIITGITTIIAAFIGGVKVGSSNTMSVTIDRFEGMIVNGNKNTIDTDKDYSDYLDGIVDEIDDAKATTKDLTERIDELNKQIIDQEKRINDLSEENRVLHQNESVEEHEDIDENSNENVDTANENVTEGLRPISWKNQGAYEEFNGSGNNGFDMFGERYTNGFTFSMGASYNLWGNEEQYAIYSIGSEGHKYDELSLLVGHVDQYPPDNVTLNIYVDKSTEDKPDYTYEIQPEIAPQQISVVIKDKSSLVIQVINQGGSQNKIGFTNIEFK